jgi:hypothetical protein
MKGLENSKKLPHYTHCTLSYLTPDQNNAEEFLIISQRDSKWVLRVWIRKGYNFFVMEC